MAVQNISFEIDDSEVRRILDRIGEIDGDVPYLLQSIGEAVESHVQTRFEEERGPDGPWPPSLRALETGGKTLTKDGLLGNSMTVQLSADGTEVQVGTNTPYANIHQFGGRAGRNLASLIPARPFLGIDDEQEDVIRDAIRTYRDRLEAELR